MIRAATGCPQCVIEDKRQRFFNTLEQRDLVCHEPDFLGSKVAHRLSCRQGHQWVARGSEIAAGRSCPTCAAARRPGRKPVANGLDRLYRAATKRGGKCLSNTYRGMKVRYSWICAKGHCWEAIGASVVIGSSWCSRCAHEHHARDQRNLRGGLPRMKAAAIARGGQCLDDDNRGIHSLYHFQCAQGHVWQSKGGAILRGTWCMRCANDARRNTIDRVHKVAAGRGWRCLSEVYQNSKEKLEWQCHRGHIWLARAGSILYQGAWCPVCNRLSQIRDPDARRRFERRMART